MGGALGNVRPEFASKPGLIIGGSSGIGKAAGTLQLEKRAEAVAIVGKNKKKLLAAEVELGSFGQVITNNTYVAHGTVGSSSRRNRQQLRRCRCWSTAPEFSFPNPFWKINRPKSGCRRPQLLCKAKRFGLPGFFARSIR
jgi:hypothetical protein